MHAWDAQLQQDLAFQLFTYPHPISLWSDDILKPELQRLVMQQHVLQYMHMWLIYVWIACTCLGKSGTWPGKGEKISSHMQEFKLACTIVSNLHFCLGQYVCLRTGAQPICKEATNGWLSSVYIDFIFPQPLGCLL